MTVGSSKYFAPYQLICVSDTFYLVVGVYLGVVGQCNVIGIENITKRDANVEGINQNCMYVPEDILLAALRDSSVKRYEEVK